MSGTAPQFWNCCLAIRTNQSGLLLLLCLRPCWMPCRRAASWSLFGSQAVVHDACICAETSAGRRQRRALAGYEVHGRRGTFAGPVGRRSLCGAARFRVRASTRTGGWHGRAGNGAAHNTTYSLLFSHVSITMYIDAYYPPKRVGPTSAMLRSPNRSVQYQTPFPSGKAIVRDLERRLVRALGL